MMSKRRYAIAIITIAVILGLLVAVGLVGCGGGDNGPAESASATSPLEESGGEVAVGPSAGPDLGDMDSDGIPTGNDAQLIMDVVVDPDSYDLTEKWIADCEDPQAPSDVNTGDALKVLRAAAGHRLRHSLKIAHHRHRRYKPVNEITGASLGVLSDVSKYSNNSIDHNRVSCGRLWRRRGRRWGKWRAGCLYGLRRGY